MLTAQKTSTPESRPATGQDPYQYHHCTKKQPGKDQIPETRRQKRHPGRAAPTYWTILIFAVQDFKTRSPDQTKRHQNTRHHTVLYPA
ncbi:MAG: hypothetical protein GY820_09210 [Gammaproteobacteria bacterium]|nr:hypothetical protein [Gammaproteobacteria bacterium]